MKRPHLAERVLTLLLSAMLVVSGLPPAAYATEGEAPTAAGVIEAEEVPQGQPAVQGYQGDSAEGTGAAEDDTALFEELTKVTGPADAAVNQDATADEREPQALGLSESPEDAQGDARDDGAEPALEAAAAPSVSVEAHVQRLGWMSPVSGGAAAGTTGRALRMEALRLRVEGASDGGIEARAHMQGLGWMGWAAAGDAVGVTGQARRMEALEVRLTGELAERYDVWYRVHAQGLGWMAWASNGEAAGTAGKSKRLEAVQVVLRERGMPAPEAGGGSSTAAFVGEREVRVAAHAQSLGWLPAVGNGAVAGTTGKGKRLEAVRVSLSGTTVPGSVEYRVHMQRLGWGGWARDGGVAGTTGRSLRVEAVQMRLTGEAAEAYDLYYRAHVQGVGWLAWAPADGVAGSTGLSLRVEALQARLVPKGQAAPESGDTAVATSYVCPLSVLYSTEKSDGGASSEMDNGKTAGNLDAVAISRVRMRVKPAQGSLAGSILYEVHSKDGAWSKSSDDGYAGLQGKRADAIKVSLSGDLAKLYDVYYRVHVSRTGWLSWAKNGATAGAITSDAAIDAIQATVILKGKAAPSYKGATYATPLLDQNRSATRACTIESYLNWAVSIANDNSHGYSQVVRWGPDYDCSSLAIASIRSAGLPTEDADDTKNMRSVLSQLGWEVIPYRNPGQLVRGDILLWEKYHCELYLGNGRVVGARGGSEIGKIYGKAGDQTGKEISVTSFSSVKSRWNFILRLR